MTQRSANRNMSDKSIQEMTLQMKKEMHAKSKKIDEFKPLSSEIKRIQDINSSFRDTTIPGSSLSKVLPQIFVKKIQPSYQRSLEK